MSACARLSTHSQGLFAELLGDLGVALLIETGSFDQLLPLKLGSL